MTSKLIRLAKAFWRETVKRLPYVIAVGLLIFIGAGIKSYYKTAEGVRIAKANTTAIQATTAAISQSVTDLKTDNKEQTKILCRLILKGTVAQRLNSSETAQVEAICKEAIDIGTANPVSQPSVNNPVNPPRAANNPPTTPKTTPTNSDTNSSGGSDNSGGTTQPPQPGPVKKIENFVNGIIKGL